MVIQSYFVTSCLDLVSTSVDYCHLIRSLFASNPPQVIHGRPDSPNYSSSLFHVYDIRVRAVLLSNLPRGYEHSS